MLTKSKRACYAEILLLGKRYRLKVIESKEEGVKLEKEYCYLFVKGKDNLKRKEKILEEWYRERAKEVFDEVIKKYQKIVRKEINKVTIRKMKTLGELQLP